MTLRPVSDGSPADWLVERGRPWPRLSLFGPVGFEAYARLRAQIADLEDQRTAIEAR